jgi:hypothetical protein
MYKSVVHYCSFEMSFSRTYVYEILKDIPPSSLPPIFTDQMDIPDPWSFDVCFVVAVCLMSPDIVCVELSGLCPPWKGCRIHFYAEGTHWKHSVIPSDRVIMTMTLGRWGPTI